MAVLVGVSDRAGAPFVRQRNRGAPRFRRKPSPSACCRSGLSLLCSAFIGADLMTFWLSPAALRTLRRLEVKILASQAPFAVQPRVFDERFPHFVLYVQDAAAAATQWRGVFLASTGGSQRRGCHCCARTPRLSAKTRATAWNCILAPAALTNTTHAIRNATMSPPSARTTWPWIFPAARLRPEAQPQRFREARLRSSGGQGPDWRDARVEFNNRIAFPTACIVFALSGSAYWGASSPRGPRCGA